ncbi:helix-turn-helix domain-containing protein [Turicibacter sp. TJ11]|uniref:helix-turn-helix domain-containing protein n=1 Tax=Turicibacter sp. TJ11 TaxID=2806443 RepID=UPI001F1F93EE|nr:helix-turn-helix transcriptional regulator [Turicibacter sp. TJ11]
MTDHRFPNLNGYYINFQLLTQKLKEIATEKGMTQSELAAGITPRDHLNKILNGKRNPSLILLYQLCNKLHVDIKLLIEQCYYHNYEQTTHYIHEMKKCTTTGDYTKLEELVKECECLTDFQFGIGKQFHIYQKGVIQLKKYNNPKKALELIEESLKTFLITDENGIECTHIFTIEEVGINTDKAICLFQLDRKKEAFELLHSTIDNRLANYESIETYHILRAHFYLSQFYLQEKQYNKSIEIASKGINLAHCKFVYIYLGDLTATKGTALYHLGDEKEAFLHFKRTYEIYTLLGSDRLIQQLDSYLTRLGVDIDSIKQDISSFTK